MQHLRHACELEQYVCLQTHKKKLQGRPRRMAVERETHMTRGGPCCGLINAAATEGGRGAQFVGGGGGVASHTRQRVGLPPEHTQGHARMTHTEHAHGARVRAPAAAHTNRLARRPPGARERESRRTYQRAGRPADTQARARGVVVGSARAGLTQGATQNAYDEERSQQATQQPGGAPRWAVRLPSSLQRQVTAARSPLAASCLLRGAAPAR